MEGESLTILDTHAWMWWSDGGGKLSPKARRAIERSGRLGISPISLWEIAALAEHGRVRFSRSTSEWLEAALSRPRVEVMPFTARIACSAAGFGDTIPGDPADRLILATALEHHAPLVTKDARLGEIDFVRTIW